MTTTKVRLLFFPTTGVGHLIPMVEAAKHLLRRDRRLSATILTMHHHHRSSPAVSSYINSIPSSGLDISFHHLPQSDDPIHAQRGEAFISLLVDCNKTHVRNAVAHYLSSSSTPVAAIIIDLFATAIIDLANEMSIPAYVYFASSAAMFSLMLYLPTLDEKSTPEETIDFPGFRSPLPRQWLPSACMDKNSDGYAWLLRHGRRFRDASGIILNTFSELEPGPLSALAAGRYLPNHPTPPVYPIGPVVALNPNPLPDNPHECIRWLERQPEASVVFLCFGSMGEFSAEQVVEIATGLERSKRRFLWVLRAGQPPEGFEERTVEMGMVWREWVPQAEVLGHRAVGGFVTHCGWNSCMEAVWFGVPMLAWPMQAEQHLNAFEMGRAWGWRRRGGGAVKWLWGGRRWRRG